MKTTTDILAKFQTNLLDVADASGNIFLDDPNSLANIICGDPRSGYTATKKGFRYICKLKGPHLSRSVNMKKMREAERRKHLAAHPPKPSARRKFQTGGIVPSWLMMDDLFTIPPTFPLVRTKFDSVYIGLDPGKDSGLKTINRNMTSKEFHDLYDQKPFTTPETCDGCKSYRWQGAMHGDDEHGESCKIRSVSFHGEGKKHCWHGKN